MFTFQTVVSVLVVLLLLEAIGLEEKMGRVLEGGNGVGSGGRGLQGARTEKCCVEEEEGDKEVRNFDAIQLPTNPSYISTLSPSHPLTYSHMHPVTRPHTHPHTYPLTTLP